MFRGTGGRLDRLVGTAFLAWLPLAFLTACSNEDPVTETALPPSPVSVQISANVDTVTVTWTASATALSYRVELTGGSSGITETAAATETSLVLTSGDGIEDGVTYSASVVDVLPAVLDNPTWRCTPSPGSLCTATGTGDIADTVSLLARQR